MAGFDYNEEYGIFSEDTLAKDWINNECCRVSWEIFQKQEDICYMQGELGKGRNPKLKDGAIDYITTLTRQSLDWLIDEIAMNMVRDLLRNDIDCSKDMAEDVNWYFGEDEFEGRDD